MIRECSTPGCSTLTFGDVCLGCLQRQARAEDAGLWGLSRSQQCQLANRGNGIGEGSAECEVVSDARAERTAGQDEGGSSSGDDGLGPGSATAAEDASNSILSA